MSNIATRKLENLDFLKRDNKDNRKVRTTRQFHTLLQNVVLHKKAINEHEKQNILTIHLLNTALNDHFCTLVAWKERYVNSTTFDR